MLYIAVPIKPVFLLAVIVFAPPPCVYARPASSAILLHVDFAQPSLRHNPPPNQHQIFTLIRAGLGWADRLDDREVSSVRKQQRLLVIVDGFDRISPDKVWSILHSVRRRKANIFNGRQGADQEHAAAQQHLLKFFVVHGRALFNLCERAMIKALCCFYRVQYLLRCNGRSL